VSSKSERILLIIRFIFNVILIYINMVEKVTVKCSVTSKDNDGDSTETTSGRDGVQGATRIVNIQVLQQKNGGQEDLGIEEIHFVNDSFIVISVKDDTVAIRKTGTGGGGGHKYTAPRHGINPGTEIIRVNGKSLRQSGSVTNYKDEFLVLAYENSDKGKTHTISLEVRDEFKKNKAVRRWKIIRFFVPEQDKGFNLQGTSSSYPYIDTVVHDSAANKAGLKNPGPFKTEVKYMAFQPIKAIQGIHYALSSGGNLGVGQKGAEKGGVAAASIAGPAEIMISASSTPWENSVSSDVDNARGAEGSYSLPVEIFKFAPLPADLPTQQQQPQQGGQQPQREQQPLQPQQEQQPQLPQQQRSKADRRMQTHIKKMAALQQRAKNIQRGGMNPERVMPAPPLSFSAAQGLQTVSQDQEGQLSGDATGSHRSLGRDPVVGTGGDDVSSDSSEDEEEGPSTAAAAKEEVKENKKEARRNARRKLDEAEAAAAKTAGRAEIEVVEMNASAQAEATRLAAEKKAEATQQAADTEMAAFQNITLARAKKEAEALKEAAKAKAEATQQAADTEMAAFQNITLARAKKEAEALKEAAKAQAEALEKEAEMDEYNTAHLEDDNKWELTSLNDSVTSWNKETMFPIIRMNARYGSGKEHFPMGWPQPTRWDAAKEKAHKFAFEKREDKKFKLSALTVEEVMLQMDRFITAVRTGGVVTLVVTDLNLGAINPTYAKNKAAEEEEERQAAAAAAAAEAAEAAAAKRIQALTRGRQAKKTLNTLKQDNAAKRIQALTKHNAAKRIQTLTRGRQQEAKQKKKQKKKVIPPTNTEDQEDDQEDQEDDQENQEDDQEALEANFVKGDELEVGPPEHDAVSGGGGMKVNRKLMRKRASKAGRRRKGTRRKGTGRKGTGRKGTRRNGTGHKGTGRKGTRRNGTGHKGTGRKGTRHKGTGRKGTRHKGTGRKGTGRKGTRHKGTGHKGTRHKGTGHKGTGHKGTGRKGTRHKGTGRNGTRRK
jgi:hypothetical protein